MKKFSIIIPSYNRYMTMKKCLESLEKQTFKDFEVIIVDDCSTDDSFEKLKEYKKESKLNIKLLKNDRNLGAGLARNNGIENADSEFVIFIDSDDYIDNNALQILNEILINNKVDCIMFDYIKKTPTIEVKRKSLLIEKKSGVINKSDALIYSNNSIWGKVYSLKIIKEYNIKFPNLKRNEDLPFNRLVLSFSNSIYYYNKPLYYYVHTKDSLINDSSLISENYAIEGFEILYKDLYEKYPNEIEAIFLKHYLYSTTSTLIYKNRKKEDLIKHIENAEKRFPNLYQNEILKNMNIYQKICMFAIKHRMFWLIKVLLKFRRIIKKVGI